MWFRKGKRTAKSEEDKGKCDGLRRKSRLKLYVDIDIVRNIGSVKY